MAMGNNHNEWLQFYHPTLAQQVSSTQPPLPPPTSAFFHSTAVVDATVVTTTTTTTATANEPSLGEIIAFGSSAGRGNSSGSYPNVEGRVGKASRRRSRASRRAPTTLLSTDATNFRAMVQQFTGIPTGPFSSRYPGERSDFGLGSREHHRHLDANATMIPSGYHPHHHQQQQHQHQQQQEHTGEEQLMFLRDNNDGFFANPRPTFEFSDGFSGNVPSHVRARASSSDNRINSYIL